MSPESDPSTRESDKPTKPVAGDPLPQVQAPGASFVLQLFLIPLIIVSIIVMVWLMFSWLAQMGSNPRDLVQDLQTLNEDSWRKAYTLANLLRSPDNADIKEDRELCRDIAAVLNQEVANGSVEENRILLRVFLCRTLGEFKVDDGIPALVRAARTERNPAELDVRYAALEGLALLGQRDHLGSAALRDHPDVLPVVLAAARERGTGSQDDDARGILRSTAAFTLGVIGGDEGLEQLARMLDDRAPNVRYNAATGLARHGDVRSVRVLREMLSPDNDLAVEGEESDEERERKQQLVLINGIRASAQLARANATADLSMLREDLRTLTRNELPARIRIDAREALLVLDERDGE